MFNSFKVISPPPEPGKLGLTHVTPRSILMSPEPLVFSNAATPSFTDHLTERNESFGIRMLGKSSTMHDSLLN